MLIAVFYGQIIDGSQSETRFNEAPSLFCHVCTRLEFPHADVNFERSCHRCWNTVGGFSLRPRLVNGTTGFKSLSSSVKSQHYLTFEQHNYS